MARLTMITRHGETKSNVTAYTLINENYQTVVMPTTDLVRAISTGKITTTNLAVSAKGLVSTNGALDKYTFINSKTNMVEGTPRAVILDRVEQDGKLAGYTVFTQNGQIRKLSVPDAAALAAKGLIANGKIRHTAEGDSVSAIGGTYPLTVIALDKAPQGKVNIDIMFCCANVNDKENAIGSATIRNIDWKNRTASLDIKLVKNSTSKGYGTDTIQTLLKYCFEEINLNRISANILEYNEASKKLFEKCNFKLEGIQKEAIYKNGKYNSKLPFFT